MRSKTNILFTVFFVVFILLSSIATLVTNFWWFSNLGFEEVFLIELKGRILWFLFGALGFFVLAYANLRIAHRFHHVDTHVLSSKGKVGILALVSFFFGLIASGNWFSWLTYKQQTAFGIVDPIFGLDVSFYVFSLPFMLSIWRLFMGAVIVISILVALDYFQSLIKHAFTPQHPHAPPLTFQHVMGKLKRSALFHLTILGSIVFLLLAGYHWLARYSIMFSEQGIVVGAGYTDVHVYLPVIAILMILAVIITLLFYVWLFYIRKQPRLRKRHIIAYVLAVYLAINIIGPGIVTSLAQSFIVSPNELNLERPYIENNIKFTNIAYGLDKVEERTYPALQALSAEAIENASNTINNVRLLDWRPLTQTYKQTQEIRLYYDLSGIDIDRYNINGEYTQVMIAPRELNQRQIAPNAQTWVNLHMIYTHGFGVVVSPVNEVTSEGLPNYLVKNIPPVNVKDAPALEVAEPRIYYGEQENNFVLVNTKAEEFDYPEGTTNQYTRYSGQGDVTLDTFFKKLMMAIRFKDIKLLLSSDITSESKILFDRSIQNRISKVAPFLHLDQDPYVVIADGKLLWIQDAYTITGNFPYSQKYRGINYIRNAVKVVVDAYEGTVTYYISEEEPLLQTYAKIYPNLFKPLSEMPSSLQEHLRYPEDLFAIQSELYSIYHMEDATVFYNKEDAWQLPSEIYGTGQKVQVEPYYVVLELPGEDEQEFVLMTSFTPIRKDNMVAWFAARSDGENYGKLVLYKFPKDKLIYGPLQVEATFDQDSEISQQLTLWSQQGSRVTRGNLLVFPIGESLLYVEPLYLQAEQGQLPQLKRVLVSDGERVVMEETLEEALAQLFGEVAVETEELQSALFYYEQAVDALQTGNWSSFGTNFDQLGEALEES